MLEKKYMTVSSGGFRALDGWPFRKMDSAPLHL